uniref:Uncharacterized protein n=1 Tax=Rhizophora mucronata TaxID=61149 RepID=A0A2P2J1T7_RHIMU
MPRVRHHIINPSKPTNALKSTAPYIFY